MCENQEFDAYIEANKKAEDDRLMKLANIFSVPAADRIWIQRAAKVAEKINKEGEE